jgi:hypothetical protein
MVFVVDQFPETMANLLTLVATIVMLVPETETVAELPVEQSLLQE